MRIYPANYPLRDCPYCPGKISNINGKGNVIQQSKYDKREHCSDCIGRARMAKRPVKVDLAMIDRFIYGGAA